jgi:hypothetical protein
VATKVIVGLYKPAGQNKYSVTFSPSNGTVQMRPAAGQTISWSIAGTTGRITAPAGASIANVTIGTGSVKGGRSGIAWPGGRPASANQWKASDTVEITNRTATTFGYTVTVNSAGTPIKSADPEIVNSPPTVATVGPDPDIVSSPPGR